MNRLAAAALAAAAGFTLTSCGTEPTPLYWYNGTTVTLKTADAQCKPTHLADGVQLWTCDGYAPSWKTQCVKLNTSNAVLCSDHKSASGLTEMKVA